MKKSFYDRRVVEAGIGGPDGWAEFWLECGHGGRIVIGRGRSLAEDTTLDCPLCRKGKPRPQYSAKLDESKVREIRTRYTAGEKQAHLAEEFRLSRSAICLILQRKRWKHVE